MHPTELSHNDPRQIISRMQTALSLHAQRRTIYVADASEISATSAVLLPLGRRLQADGRCEVCLILNKRSRQVRQAGDLCCPGGSVYPPIDFRAARLLSLPMLPLGRWPYWRAWRRSRPLEARWLALYLATSLRESFEEMRLNPLRIRFLGPLEPQRLILFRRLVYPLAAWIPHQKWLRPNWEVERIVSIPLRHLLDPSQYVRYRLTLALTQDPAAGVQTREHPAFRFATTHGTELLWGVTYRIIMSFLNCGFGFVAPPAENLPLVLGHLEKSYLTGEPS
jgi:hypothetical protein